MDTVAMAFITVTVLMVLLKLVASLIVVCEPYEVVVLSGFGSRDTGGASRQGYRILQGGRKFRIPWIEQVDRLDMRLMPIEITCENAYSEGGIPLDIRAIANVKVSSNTRLIGNAIERFLRMPRTEIEKVARETLEGNLRGVLATMTPEEVNEDRLKFSNLIQTEVQDDLEKLGLEVDTLKIQNVHDKVDYLDSISRVAISEVQKQAAVAESDAQRTASNTEAEAQARTQVAQQKADMAIKQKQNALAALQSELEGTINSELERTEAAGRQARALAEKELQEIRTRLEALKLEAEVVLPAEAEREASRMRAEGEASRISERGRATAQAFSDLAATWQRAGGDARDIFVMQKLEDILGDVVASVKRLKPGKVTLVDSGDGKTLPAYVASYPGIVASVLGELQSTLGIDIAAVLRGEGASSAGVGPAVGSPGARGGGAADLTPEAVFELLVVQSARDGRLEEFAKGVLPKLGEVLGLDPGVQKALLEKGRASAASEAASGSEVPRVSPESLYARSYFLAIRDRKLTPTEKKLLQKLAVALNLPEDRRQQLENEVRTRTGLTEPGPDAARA